MKIKVSVVVELDREQVKILKQTAETCGHGLDGCKAPCKVIRRYLESQVIDAVTYCRERLSKD